MACLRVKILPILFDQKVPFGNIELDRLLFTADVFFSRALRDQQQVGFPLDIKLCYTLCCFLYI